MKKTTKKLVLSRETVRSLDEWEVRQVGGGIVSSDNIECMMERRKLTGTGSDN